MSAAEANGIRAIFAELDAITGASFVESRPEDANIVLYSVQKYKRNWDGLSEFNAKHYVATWKDFGGKRLTRYEVAVIRHENRSYTWPRPPIQRRLLRRRDHCRHHNIVQRCESYRNKLFTLRYSSTSDALGNAAIIPTECSGI